MKYVINGSFGGFSLPKGFVKKMGLSNEFDYNSDIRESEELINYLEENNPEYCTLRVIEIPDNATDWQLHEYDGLEFIICVIDGKIIWLN